MLKIIPLKKAFFLLLCIAAGFCMQAQQGPTAANYDKIKTIPAFRLFAVPDSIAFTNEQLKKDKPVMLMFFSPDCDHCQKETKELLAYKEELKGIQIVMASIANYAQIKTFYEDYGLKSMPNITMGQDPNYALGGKFNLRTYPSMFIYDAKGNLAKAFTGNISIPAILDAVK